MILNQYTVDFVNGDYERITTPFCLDTLITLKKGVVKDEMTNRFIVLDKIVQFSLIGTKEVLEDAD